MTEAPVVCARCGTESTSHRDNTPWCEHCGIYLVHHPATGEWISIAEQRHREDQARYARWRGQCRARIREDFPEVRAVVPAEWNVQVHDEPAGLPYLRVLPPVDHVEVSAYLFPPHDGQPAGWYVRIGNRSRGIDFPLYIPGGARAAYFTTAAIAAHKAVEAVLVERRSRP